MATNNTVLITGNHCTATTTSLQNKVDSFVMTGCSTSGSTLTVASALPLSVVVGSAVALSGGVSVPQGTTVATIAANRLSLTMTSAASANVSGTAQAIFTFTTVMQPVNAAAPVASLLNPDRSIRYSAAFGSGFEVMFNLLGSKTVDHIGLVGIKRDATASVLGQRTVTCYGWHAYPEPLNNNCATNGATLTSTTPFSAQIRVGSVVQVYNSGVTNDSFLMTGCSTSGSTLTVASALPSSVVVGSAVVLSGGVSVPQGTTVATIAGNRLSLTMTNAASANVSGTAQALFTVSSLVAAGTTVVSIAANRLSLVMSNAASVNDSNLWARFTDKALLGTFNYKDESDVAIALPAPVSCRFVQFTVDEAVPAAFSSFLAGTSIDLGIAYSAGSSDSVIKQVVENQTIEGTTTLTITGASRQGFKTIFSKIPQSTRDAIVSVVRNNKTLLIKHPRGLNSIQECRLVGNVLDIVHDFGPPDLYSLTLNLETIP